MDDNHAQLPAEPDAAALRRNTWMMTIFFALAFVGVMALSVAASPVVTVVQPAPRAEDPTPRPTRPPAPTPSSGGGGTPVAPVDPVAPPVDKPEDNTAVTQPRQPAPRQPAAPPAAPPVAPPTAPPAPAPTPEPEPSAPSSPTPAPEPIEIPPLDVDLGL